MPTIRSLCAAVSLLLVSTAVGWLFALEEVAAAPPTQAQGSCIYIEGCDPAPGTSNSRTVSVNCQSDWFEDDFGDRIAMLPSTCPEHGRWSVELWLKTCEEPSSADPVDVYLRQFGQNCPIGQLVYQGAGLWHFQSPCMESPPTDPYLFIGKIYHDIDYYTISAMCCCCDGDACDAFTSNGSEAYQLEILAVGATTCLPHEVRAHGDTSPGPGYNAFVDNAIEPGHGWHVTVSAPYDVLVIGQTPTVMTVSATLNPDGTVSNGGLPGFPECDLVTIDSTARDGFECGGAQWYVIDASAQIGGYTVCPAMEITLRADEVTYTIHGTLNTSGFGIPTGPVRCDIPVTLCQPLSATELFLPSGSDWGRQHRISYDD